MFCSHCESRIFDTDRTCPQCGAPTRNYIKVEREQGKAPKRYLVSIAQAFFRDIDTFTILGEGIANIDSAFSFNSNFNDDRIYSSYHNQQMMIKTIMTNEALSDMNMTIGDYYNLILLAKTIDVSDNKNITYTRIEVPKLRILGIGIMPKEKCLNEEEWLDQEYVVHGVAEANKGISCNTNYYAKVSNNLKKIPEFAESYA